VETDVTSTGQPASPEGLVGRILESAIGAMDIFSLYLGEQLGYYRALHEGGAATSAELAARTGTAERYAREWLEQQTATGILTVEDASRGALERRYALPKGYEEVLLNPLSDLFVAPLGRFLAGTMQQTPALLHAYRTGGGVSWDQLGDAARTAQADFNRPFFQHHLVGDYLSQIPGLDAALRAPGARVAEVGCGAGWAAIAIAQGYPAAEVDGYDIDGPSIEMARANIEGSDVAARVRFHHRDAATAEADGSYDLVCAFECIHDMPDPVSVLRTMRGLAKPGGAVIVMDERVADAFGAIGDFNERLFYGFSLTVCLPDGLSTAPSVGTGTVMRTSTLREYARAAGFGDVEVLPLEHDLFRFYRLVG
jgi:SAM-dependent methyltransferase